MRVSINQAAIRKAMAVWLHGPTWRRSQRRILAPAAAFEPLELSALSRNLQVVIVGVTLQPSVKP
jgi:hypothetical protein